jgi:ArsR family transcriptional regulator, arsenate/arsenite/antimonite-responsive transcriptional repressor
MTKRRIASVVAADPCCGSILESPLTEHDASDHAAAFAALGDPARLRLLSLIATAPSGEACVCDLVEPIGKSQPTVSHHLRVLADAGLVTSERRGRWAWYRAVPEQLDRLRAVLMPRA